LLFIGLRRKNAYQPEPGWAAFTLRVVVASVLLGGFLMWAAQAVPWITMQSRDLQRIGLMAACLVAAVALYFGALLATGLKFGQFLRRG
jgi:putative peptidoglycan lipid II flippase